MPSRQVTLSEIPWRHNPPTPFHCSFLWNGHEHHFEFTIDPKRGAYARKKHSDLVSQGSGCTSWIPTDNFEEMRRLALAVMLATDEERARLRADWAAGKELVLEPKKKRKKGDDRQLTLL